MNAEIANIIAELNHTVTVAGLNYEIWWVYKGSDTRPKYVDTMNRYPLFFQTSLHAHFVATVMALYRLHETRNDTYNIPKLLRILKNEKSLDKATLDHLGQEYDKVKPLWQKISILRNKSFGHRSAAHSVEDVFEEAQVASNDLKQLVEMTKKILNELSYACNQSRDAFNLCAREDTIRLLDDLQRDA